MRRHRPGRGATRAWWASFLVLFALGALWSLASPLFSVADEPAHAVRAAAVARGQLGGRDSTAFDDRQVRTEVRVPLVYATATTLPVCYLGRTEVAASCAPPFAGPEEEGPVLTQVGRYPPAYYAVVGVPARWFPAPAAVRVMRLVSAAVAAALLASAFTSLRELGSTEDGGSPSLLLGLAVAVSPTLLFLAGSVNPNGVEVAAAVSFWTALCGLLLGRGPAGGARFAARAAVAGSVLVVARQLGPLLAVLILVVVAVVAGRDRLRAVAGRAEVRRAAAVVGGVMVLAVAWLVARDTFSGIGGTPPPTALDFLEVVQTSVGRTGRNVLQMIATFGWADTPAPVLTYYVWFACCGFLLLAALARAGRRQTVGLLLLVGLVVAVPVVFESWRAREIGFAWLGRYTLPLAVGIPILASWLAGDLVAGVGRRLVPLFAGAVAVGHLLAFVWALERYTGGTGTGGADGWTPPGTAPVLVVAFAAATAVYGRWLCRVALSPTR